MTGLQKLSISLLAGSSVFLSVAALAQDATGNLPAMAPAQSAQTATDVGTIEVQGAGQALGSGYIVPEDGPKDRSTVTQQGIQNQIPTSNPFQLISILPGVNVETDDAIGLGGGTIRVRGLVASQMGFTINGAPFNDSGTFNVYPSEIIDAENISRIWVTHGSTDIDAPHVGASGGNIGVVTRVRRFQYPLRSDRWAIVTGTRLYWPRHRSDRKCEGSGFLLLHQRRQMARRRRRYALSYRRQLGLSVRAPKFDWPDLGLQRRCVGLLPRLCLVRRLQRLYSRQDGLSNLPNHRPLCRL